MSHCDRLLANYRRFVRLPWSDHLAGKQKVWFAVYPPSEERRVRAHIQEFQVSTLDAGHKWQVVDITDVAAKWLAGHSDREGYFSAPDAICAVEQEVRIHVAQILRAALQAAAADSETVLAVIGTGSLFGFAHISPIISEVEDAIRGRLLVFFPGEYERNLYRFMDARDGFNYMAVPITSNESVFNP